MAGGDHELYLDWEDTIGVHYIFAVVITIITVMIIGTNILNICVIANMPTLWNPSGYFLVQLSIVDLMTGVFLGLVAIPSAILNRWAMGEFMCSFAGYCGTCTITLSVNTLALVSIDRCFYVVWPFKYSTIMTNRKAYACMATVWMVNIIFYVIPFAVPEWDVDLKFHYWEGAYICSFGFENNFLFFMFALGIVFVPANLLIIVCHLIMYVTARKHMRILEASIGRLGPPPAVAMVALKTSNAFKTTATILVMFTIAYLPKVCFSLSLSIIRQHDLDIRVPPYMAGVVWWIAISNSFMNFFIYSFRNKDFKAKAKQLIKGFLERLQDRLPTGNMQRIFNNRVTNNGNQTETANLPSLTTQVSDQALNISRDINPTI